MSVYDIYEWEVGDIQGGCAWAHPGAGGTVERPQVQVLEEWEECEVVGPSDRISLRHICELAKEGRNHPGCDFLQ